MSAAAATIAPALNPLSTSPRRIEPVAVDAPAESPVAPQHMQALARANEVRLARAELKRQVAAGRRSATEVVMECPWEAESMSVIELLCSQRRWGRARSRKLIVSADPSLTENKKLGTLTERQRKVLAGALLAKETA